MQSLTQGGVRAQKHYSKTRIWQLRIGMGVTLVDPNTRVC